MYATFNATSSESLDSIFNRLQKIVSQLTILGEVIPPEELNLKFLRSLPSERSMHVVVWRNKSEVKGSVTSSSISFDDLYNNFKIVEPEVKGSVTSSLNSGSQNLAFVSASSSTNDGNTANVHVSTASTNNSTACLNDLDKMDLKWQLALLSMKARKFYQRTEKKIVIDGSDTAGYDKKRVECFNYHNSRRTVNVEESPSKAMIAIDGVGFDCSYMAKEEAPTNFALMEFLNSKVQNNKTCSKACLKNFEDLKSRYDKLRIEFNKSKSDLDNYKRGFASVEEQLVFYKKNEGMLCDQIAVLKRDASFNESDIDALKKQVERLKKEKESIKIKVDGFENASKSLDTLIGSQPEFEGNGVKISKSIGENVSKEVKKTLDAPIIEDWVSDCDEDEDLVLESLNVQQKPKQADQPRKVSQNSRNNRTNWNTPITKKLGVGIQFKPKACFVCGSLSYLIKDCDFHDKRMVQKPVFNNVQKGTDQREVRPVWNNAMRTNHQNFSNSRRNFAPTAVLTKSDLLSISTAGQSFSKTAASVSAARPFNTAVTKPSVNVAKQRTHAFQKSHSPLRRSFCQQTALKNRNLNNKVNTDKVISVNNVQGKSMTSVVGEQVINAVKPTSYWVWRPKIKFLDHVSKNSRSYMCKQFDYVDPTGSIKSVMAWVLKRN
ncbi:hypothetical protein Tco_1299991 [Tanacetum coccineum]